MTPWLRITPRHIRLLLVLAVTLPAYGTVTAPATPAYAAEPAPSTSPHPDAGPSNQPAPDAADHPAPAHTGRLAPEEAGHLAPGEAGRTRHPGRQEHADGHSHGHGHGHGHDDFPATDPSPIPLPIPPRPAVPPIPPLPPMPSDSASASYRPAAVEPTRAGSRAGEGRMRPGRPDGPAAEVEGDDDPVPTQAPGTGHAEEPEIADLPTATPPTSTVPDHPPAPARNPARQGSNASEPVLQILPLGSGLILIGLGLALALLGLRLRRA
ncbi:hypothetical protein ACWC2T_04910 [Streptomyces sp. NPDC001393]